MTSGTGKRRVTVVSPHFDDVPLSLGQSLRNGLLSQTKVHVRVAFGRTNWTTFVHPTPSRAPYVGLWRRAEETAASLVFRYRWTAAGWTEVLLRSEELADPVPPAGAGGRAPKLDSGRILDTELDLAHEPLVGQIAEWLSMVASPRSGPPPALLLVCAGLGGHIDHRIVALAAATLVGHLRCPIGFYEDRPYVSYLDTAERDRQLAPLGLELRPIDVSDPVTRSTQMLARRCYPSQMVEYFEQAMDLDRDASARERVWFPVDAVPDWV